jgi:hypothetical protein
MEFLDSIPAKVAAEIHAVLDAVAAPPPSFSGGGKWEAMHDDMAGYFDVRVQGAERTTGSSASWSVTLRASAGPASSASTDCRSLRARRFTRGTTGGSSATAPSSRSGGPCSSSGGCSAWCWHDLQFQSSGKRHQGRECGVRPLRREETADRLRLHPGTSSQFGLREMQFFATCIHDTDHRVDLFDSLACRLIRLAVLRIGEATSEAALCASLCRCHGLERSRNVYVTHISRRSGAGGNGPPSLHRREIISSDSRHPSVRACAQFLETGIQSCWCTASSSACYFAGT